MARKRVVEKNVKGILKSNNKVSVRIGRKNKHFSLAKLSGPEYIIAPVGIPISGELVLEGRNKSLSFQPSKRYIRWK